jgi:hypothetical protein
LLIVGLLSKRSGGARPDALRIAVPPHVRLPFKFEGKGFRVR